MRFEQINPIKEYTMHQSELNQPKKQYPIEMHTTDLNTYLIIITSS